MEDVVDYRELLTQLCEKAVSEHDPAKLEQLNQEIDLVVRERQRLRGIWPPIETCLSSCPRWNTNPWDCPLRSACPLSNAHETSNQ
jgi:hypothetical protein